MRIPHSKLYVIVSVVTFLFLSLTVVVTQIKPTTTGGLPLNE